jgi:RND family efflux transporter MFP subunit
MNTNMRMNRRMKWLALSVAALLVIGGGVALTHEHWGRDATEGTVLAAASADVYYCPMHPQYTSDKPGNCPICHMKLVKKEPVPAPADAPQQHQHGATSAPEATPASAAPDAAGGTIFVPPQRQQLIGVQIVEVQPRAMSKEIRTVGKVAVDESRTSHVHAKVAGYIEQVFADYVGKPVKRGEPLFTIYSPELVATQQEFLIALRGHKQLADSPYPDVARGAASLVEAARERLRLWDISDKEMEALEKEGKVKRALTIYSPASGIITQREAFQNGRYVSPEMDLYTIVDLSQIWILGEVYESDFPFVRVGQTAEIELPYANGARVLRGRIDYFFPFLNAQTRTGQVRVVFPNPGMTLKPEMYVNLKLESSLGQYLAVPSDAVFDTGTEQHVFVDKGNGYFEPRRVEIGAEADGYIALLRGVKRGERVVTAANFLLDSESRIKGAFANFGAPSAAPQQPGAMPEQALRIEILEPRAPKVAGNDVKVVVRDPAGRAVEDAAVEFTLFRRAMGTMPPMTARAALRHAGGGQYTGRIEVPMAGTYQATVNVRRAGVMLGSLQSSLTAR